MQERRPTIDLKEPKAESADASEGGGATPTKRRPIYVHQPKVGAASPTDETQEIPFNRVPGAAQASAHREVLLRTLVRELPGQLVILAAGVIGLLGLLVIALTSERHGAAPTGAPPSPSVAEVPKPPASHPPLAIVPPSPPATPIEPLPSNREGTPATVAVATDATGRPSEIDRRLCDATAAYYAKEDELALNLFSKLTQAPDPKLANSAKFMVDVLARRLASRGAP